MRFHARSLWSETFKDPKPKQRLLEEIHVECVLSKAGLERNVCMSNSHADVSSFSPKASAREVWLRTAWTTPWPRLPEKKG